MDEEKKKRSLRFSVLDGTSHAAMLGFGESFFVVFAVFLKANNIQLGLLGSLPQAIGSLMQLLSHRLLSHFRTRKRLVITAALVQGALHIPIALVFFLGTLRVYHLLLFAILYWIAGSMLGPAWNSWMGDLTDARMRGAYFGMRNKITGFATFASFLLAGYILQRFADGEGMRYTGFAVIFALALLARLISCFFLLKIEEPSFEPPAAPDFTILQFMRESLKRNFGLFVIYLAAMNFAAYVSIPFFTPYMLKDLGLDYVTFTAITSAALISKLIFMPVWGAAADRFGTKKVLSLSGFLMPMVPLLWAFSGDFHYLLIIQVYSGFIWAGFEMASFNFVFDATSPQRRMTCIAYYNVINGMAILTGAVAGGFLVRYNELFASKYLFVFIVSTALRYLASVVFLPRIKEVREVEHIPYSKLLLKLISTMPTRGLVYQMVVMRKNKARKEPKG